MPPKQLKPNSTIITISTARFRDSVSIDGKETVYIGAINNAFRDDIGIHFKSPKGVNIFVPLANVLFAYENL